MKVSCPHQATFPLIYRAFYIIPKLALRYFHEPLNLGGKMIHILIFAFNGHELSTTLLCLDTSFVIMRHATKNSILISNWVLRPKSINHSPIILKSKLPNIYGEACPLHPTSSTMSTLVTICSLPLDHQVLQRLCFTKAPSVLTWSISTVYLSICTLACRCPQLSVIYVSFLALVRSVLASRLSFTAFSLLAWRNLTCPCLSIIVNCIHAP